MKKVLLAMVMMAMMAGMEAQTQPNDWGGLHRYTEQNKEVMKLPKEQRRVVFLGNSITEFWAKMRPEFFTSHGYVGRGISGHTSYQFLIRFRQDVVDLHPDLVVINAATNDVAENQYPYNEDETLNNFKTMVDLAKANNIKVILTTTLPASSFWWRTSIEGAAEKIAKLNARVKKWAEENNIPYLDYYSHMVVEEDGSLDKRYSDDGVHPSVGGYEVMEPLIVAEIEKVLGINEKKEISFAEEIAAPADNISVTRRPAPEKRLFTAEAIEKEIERVKKALANAPYLAWMFENCFPNTLDTTVHYSQTEDGDDDTFVYTGDIHAMWLRDSGAQVWPYVQFAKKDENIRHMVRGTILRQFKCINIDPYANAFNIGPTGTGWMTDMTDMKPELHERKYEIDSFCYPVRLAYEYWKVTGDDSIFGDVWMEAIKNIVKTIVEQQRKEGNGPYTFMRQTERQFDTMSNNGLGAPVKPCGLIVSAFRPSDDATVLQYLVPSNFFAVTTLRKAAEILTKVNKEKELAAQCKALANEVEEALKKYAVYDHPKYGKIYAFEVDGFGNQLLMDDANVPSLLAMAYLGDVSAKDPIYQNTRRFVWSEDNPYFFRGKAGEGIGGPHVGWNMVWPMSIMMKAFTSNNDEEIRECLQMLVDTDNGTGFIHESFNKDDASNYTRSWFAWQNTLFGELILKLLKDGKKDILLKVSK